MFLTMQGLKRRMGLHKLVNANLTEAGNAAAKDTVKFSATTAGTVAEWREWDQVGWIDTEGKDGAEVRFLTHVDSLNGDYVCRLFLSREDILFLLMKAFMGESVENLIDRLALVGRSKKLRRRPKARRSRRERP